MSLVAVPRVDRPLHDHQAIGINGLRESLRCGKRRPVLQAPTGTGKTRLAGEVLKLAEGKDRRVVFTVPRIDLVDQTLHSFWQDGIANVGVIQANHPETDYSRPIQIASVQTLAKRGFPETDLVVVDECHMAFDVIYKWMKEKPNLVFIGLSATPWTRGLGAADRYDDLVVVGTTQSMIEKKFLSDFRVFAPSHPDLTGVRTRMGDFVESDLTLAMNQSPLVADVVDTWLRRGERRPTLVFGVDCAHAKHLQERFIGAGVACGYQDARTSPYDRAILREQFHSGAVQVVCNVGTLTTGVDWDVRCIVLARPTKSEILYTQIVGRGLRTAAGKDYCMILDHSDTTLRLGFVTDIHHEALDDGSGRAKEERSAPLPKECPNCAFLKPPRVSVCPMCGHKTMPPANTVSNLDGELIEFDRRDAARLQMDRQNRIKLRDEVVPADEFYAQLIRYAQERGYKPGYASAKFKDATGKWPPAEFKRLEPQRVSFGVHTWLRAQARAYGKRQQRAGR